MGTALAHLIRCHRSRSMLAELASSKGYRTRDKQPQHLRSSTKGLCPPSAGFFFTTDRTVSGLATP